MVSGTSREGNVKFTRGKYTISDGRHELLSKCTLVSRVSAKLIWQEMVKIFSVWVNALLYINIIDAQVRHGILTRTSADAD